MNWEAWGSPPASKRPAAASGSRGSAIGAGAAAGFALFVFAARAAHPGTGASSHATVTQQSFPSNDDESSNGFDFGSGSIGPSDGGFSVQSGGS